MIPLLENNKFSAIDTKIKKLKDKTYLLQWADYPNDKKTDIEIFFSNNSFKYCFFDNGYVASVAAHLTEEQVDNFAVEFEIINQIFET